MPLLKVKNYLYRTKSFWITKKWFDNKPIFSFWKKVYQGGRAISDTKNTFNLLLPTLPSFIKTTIYSVVVIIVFESFNFFYPTNIIFDEEAVDTLLAAIASITGVFLGLYFTAISSIASNLLIKATQDIRRFFLSSPKGQQYVQTIALTAIITIFYIVAKSFGHTIHPVGLASLALLTSYVVVRFWTVSSAVFNSLEPADSLPWVTKEIADSIKGVIPPGFQWSKSALQNHQRRLVAANLELIGNIINFGIKEIKISDDQLIIALKHLGGLLYFYSDNKNKIPTNSYWFMTKNKYESWTLANSTQIALALNTGTTLQPKTIKDYIWFEEQVLGVVAKILKYLVNERRVGSVFQGFEIFVEVSEIYGKDFDEQGLEELFKKLEEGSNLIHQIIKFDASDSITQKELLAFTDSEGRLAIAALLGLSKYLDKQTVDDIAATISKINWISDDKTIYLAGLPLPMVSRLESMAQELKNERLIEGKILSQDWYIKTLCFQRYVFSLQTYFNYIKALHQDYFSKKFEKLLVDGQLPLAAQFIQRWIEFSNKYQRLVCLLKKHIEDCKHFRSLKDLSWATFDFPQEERIAQCRIKEVSDRMIGLLPKLQNLKIEDDLPDYFGQALTIGIEACFEACDDNNHERLKKIFLIVFQASLAAHDMTRQKVQSWSQEDSKIIYSTEPLINLFEITGYAKLYAELYNNQELWNVVKISWDVYFASTTNAKQVIEFIAAICSYRDGLFMIMPQAALRSNWQISFEHRMRERGIPVFPDSGSYDSVNRRRQPTHQSPIIRVLERSGGLRLMASARDIFFATYLSNLPDAVGVELPDRHNFKNSIQEEEQNPNEEIDEDE
ncbi:MAG: hypothetical protein WC415_03340 [Patescibacteria group bacterium]|jgi:hypothetical protein